MRDRGRVAAFKLQCSVKLCALGEGCGLARLRTFFLLVLHAFANKSRIFCFRSNASAEISMLQLRESTRRATTGFAELTMILSAGARGNSPHM